MEKLKNLVYLLMAVPVLAQDTIEINPPSNFNTLKNVTVPNMVMAGIKLILIVAAIASFVFLVIGGIKWITSGGDKEKTAKAQSTITAALIGLLIVFAAWAITRLLQAFFGIETFSFTIPKVTEPQ